MIKIREFQQGDEAVLRALFYHTIRKVNLKDYSVAQVQAWAPDNYDQAKWAARMAEIKPFIALINEQIVGYADVQQDGYIDHFFCHAGFQGQGIGKTLMQHIHQKAEGVGCMRLYSHVSKTAKPFFEHFGFQVQKKQQVSIRGQLLTNFVMDKTL